MSLVMVAALGIGCRRARLESEATKDPTAESEAPTPSSSAPASVVVASVDPIDDRAPEPCGPNCNAASVVASMASAFRRCYSAALERDPELAGTIRVTARIGAGGEVTSASPTAKPAMPRALLDCVAARVAKAQFAPPEAGRATLIIPVSFAHQ